MTQLLQERQKLFEKLEQKIKEKDETEIQCTMDSLRLRLGLSGRTRNQALNSFFQDIIHLIMPFHMKYLIWIALENLDIFSADKDSDSTDSNWFQNSGMTEEQKSQVRDRILQSKEDYDDIMTQLDFLKRRMGQANENAQNFIDDLRNFFPPINIAKFLISLDKKRASFDEQNIYPASFWSNLQQVKNIQLAKPVSNNTNTQANTFNNAVVTKQQQQQLPFQNKPTLILENVENNFNSQLPPEAAIKYANQGQQSLNSSQCSFSVDQFNRQAEYLSRLSQNNSATINTLQAISFPEQASNFQQNLQISPQIQQLQGLSSQEFNTMVQQPQQLGSDKHGMNGSFTLHGSPQQNQEQQLSLGSNSLYFEGRKNHYEEGDYRSNSNRNIGQQFHLGQNQSMDFGVDATLFNKYYDLNTSQFLRPPDQN